MLHYCIVLFQLLYGWQYGSGEFCPCVPWLLQVVREGLAWEAPWTEVIGDLEIV